MAAGEAVARAVLEKPPPAGRALTPHQERAAKIREIVAKEGPRSAIESMNGEKTPDLNKLDNLNYQNFGTDRDINGKKILTVAERTRVTDAAKWEALAKVYSEQGYAGLVTSGKIGDARKFVEQAVNAWPEAQAFLATLKDPADKLAVLDEIIKDGAFALRVKDGFKKATGDEKILKDEVSEKRDEFEEAKNKEALKRGEVTTNGTEITTNSADLAQFNTGGLKDVKLRTLEAAMPTLLADKATKEDEWNDAKGILTTLRQSKTRMLLRDPLADTTAVDDSIRTQAREVQRIKNEYDDVTKQIQDKEDLEKEKTTLKEKEKTLSEKKIALDAELKTLERERITKQAAFEDAKITRAMQEQGFVDDLQNIFSNATMEYLQDRVRAAETAEKTLADEERANAVDPMEKALLDAEETRYDKTKGGKPAGVNEKQVETDFNAVMTTRDPKALLRQILIEAKDGGGTPLFSGTEIEAKLNDPEFIAKMQPRIVARLLTRKFQTGKKMSENEARIIMETEWGQAAVNKAIANKKEVREGFDKLREEGLLKGSIFEWYKTKSGGSVLKLLLLLFGTATILPFAGMKLGDMLKSE